MKNSPLPIFVLAALILAVVASIFTAKPKNLPHYKDLGDNNFITCVEGYQYLAHKNKITIQLKDERDQGFPCQSEL